MKKQLIIIAFIFGLFISCSKNNTKTDPLVEKTNILTESSWYFTDYYRNDGIGTIVTTYADLPNCRKDDFRTFKKDGTGENNEGPTKCNVTDPQSQPVQWRFLNNYATSIELNGVEYYIDKLETHEFRFRKKPAYPGDPNQISYGYSR